jgi:hypothetical protein
MRRLIGSRKRPLPSQLERKHGDPSSKNARYAFKRFGMELTYAAVLLNAWSRHYDFVLLQLQSLAFIYFPLAKEIFRRDTTNVLTVLLNWWLA